MSKSLERASGDRRRTLWVAKNFAQPGHGDYEFEKAVWDLFAANGDIKINRGFSYDRGRRPGDAGIHSQLELGIGWLERHEKIINESGANKVRAFTPLQILEYDGPVVAKIDNVERGEGKYLIRSPEDKLHIAAFSLLKADVIDDIYTDPDIDRRYQRLADLFEKIKRGEIDGPEFIGKGSWRSFTFEQYIQTPSDRFTSFRIVADSFGYSHSALLLYSSTTKEDAMSKVRDLSSSSKKARLYDLYLLDPESPFYIPTPSIVSNHSMGGGQINFLYSEAVSEEQAEIQQNILKAHGFDLNNPKLPEHLLVHAKDLGWRFGQEYIFTGLDFIMDAQTGKFYLLEMNSRSMVDPEDIGLSPDTYTSDQAGIELLKRIKEEMMQSRISPPPTSESQLLRKQRGLTK